MDQEQAERILSEVSAFWARVEVMGRRTYHGHVRVESLGGVAFFRVDIPAIPERTVRERGYFKSEGAEESEFGLFEITYPARPGNTHLVGASSIYQITPIAEPVAVALTIRDGGDGKPIKITKIDNTLQIEGESEEGEGGEEFEPAF